MRWSSILRVSLVSLAVPLHQLALGAVLWAAPITVDLTRQLTYVCDEPVVDENACPRDDTVVNFSITYDPDTLVVTDWPIGDHLETSGPLTYTFPRPALDIPWGGPVDRFATASLTQITSDFRSLDLNITDQSFGPDGEFWRTRLLMQAFFPSPASGPLTPEDFEAALRLESGAGGVLFFSFQTLLFSDGAFAPGSRVYTGYRIPEPAMGPLFAVALGTFAVWRRRRSRTVPWRTRTSGSLGLVQGSGEKSAISGCDSIK